VTTGTELEVNLSTLLGLNNRRPDFRLRTKDGVFVRAASNTLISDAGTAKRRRGYTQEFAGSDCHSFWVDRVTDTGFYVDGSTMYRATAAGGGLARQVIATDMVRGRQLTYAHVGTDVVFSDGVSNRCVAPDGVRPFGVPDLQVLPTVTASAGGALAAGDYQVCFAFANPELELSGTTPAQLVTVLTASGSITVSGLPAAWPAGADTLIVYVTDPNGQTPLAERRLSAPVDSITISTLAGSGMQASTEFQAALPPGRILRYFGSRLYAADGPVLRYSEVYSPALHMPARNHVQFPAPITVMEPCDDGLFVVADATYWLAGDIEKTTLKTVLPCTAVFGTAGVMPHEQRVFWMSSRGLVIGGAGGVVELRHDENVVVPSAAAGASFVLEADGQRHAVSSLFGAEGAIAAATSYMVAEVIRKGTTL
jgi:hypothetical protein